MSDGSSLVGSRWFRWVTVFAVSAGLLGGCGHRETVTVRSWREPGRVERVNTRIVDYDNPRLTGRTWREFPFGLDVQVEADAKVRYDLKKHFTVKRVTRTSGKRAKSGAWGTMIFVSVMTVGLGAPVFLIAGRKELFGELPSVSKAVEAEGVQRILKKGYGSIEYKGGVYRINRDEGKPEIIADQTGSERAPAPNVPVRCEVGGRLVTAVTDQRGRARLTLAESRPQLHALKPGPRKLEAQWKGQWIPLEPAMLTQAALDKASSVAAERWMTFTGPEGLPPLGEVTIETPAVVDADGVCEVAVTVTNKGKGTFYRLAGGLQSADPAFDGVRFEFGKIVPGEALTVTRRIPIPRLHRTAPATFRLMWSELHGYTPDVAVARTMVRGKDRAVFATAVQVIDDMTGRSVGNGDGRIQKGEAVDLLVTVKNIGDGRAEGATVTLSGLSDLPGVVVPTGSAELGSLDPGQSGQVRLTVTTKKAARLTALTPELTVRESYLGVTQRKKLNFALGERLTTPILEYRATRYAGPSVAVVRAGAGDDTGMLAQVDPGVALQVTGELGSWCRIEDEQFGTGWVARSQLTDEPPRVSAAPTSTGGVVRVLARRKPLLAIMAPTAGAKLTRPELRIEGMAGDDQGVTAMKFFLNGQAVEPAVGGKAIGVAAANPADAGEDVVHRERRFSVPVRLRPGANEITVTAVNTQGLEETKTCTVTFEQPTGRTYLVAIGINAYQNVRPQLRFAAADARAVAACLQKHLRIPPANTTLLIDGKATRRAILGELGVRLRNKARREDTVIIYFSGHGAPEADPRSPDNDGVEKYLLPVDAEKDSLYSTAVAMDEVKKIFQRIDSERIVFLVDSCYSGQVGGRSLASGRRFRNIECGRLLQRLQQTGKGRVIITASAGGEVSQENEQYGHGVFTYHLLRGLAGAADADANGEVTAFELFTYVNREVPAATNNRQHPKAKMEDVDGSLVLSFPKKPGA